MLRKILIFITALAIFIIAASALEFLVPLILGIDELKAELMRDPEAVKSFMERQPVAFYLGLVLVHAVSAIAGGMVAGLGDLPKWTIYLLAGGFMGLGYLFVRPGSPTWYLIFDLSVYIPGALLGYEWVSRTRQLVAEKAKGK